LPPEDALRGVELKEEMNRWIAGQNKPVILQAGILSQTTSYLLIP
jgi:hypothetical protein